MDTIPKVANAVPNVTKSEKYDGILVPGSVAVTYQCANGYFMDDERDAVTCEYESEVRNGRNSEHVGQNLSRLVTAVWKGHEGLYCQEGKSSSHN